MSQKFYVIFYFSRRNSESKLAIWKAQGDPGEQRALSPLPQGIHQWVWKSHQDVHVELIHSSQAGKVLAPPSAHGGTILTLNSVRAELGFAEYRLPVTHKEMLQL